MTVLFFSRENFRALLSPNHTSNLPIVFDAVRCKFNDTLQTKNIWQCETSLPRGHCDAHVEAAAVLCGPLPSRMAPGSLKFIYEL